MRNTTQITRDKQNSRATTEDQKECGQSIAWTDPITHLNKNKIKLNHTALKHLHVATMYHNCTFPSYGVSRFSGTNHPVATYGAATTRIIVCRCGIRFLSSKSGTRTNTQHLPVNGQYLETLTTTTGSVNDIRASTNKEVAMVSDNTKTVKDTQFCLTNVKKFPHEALNALVAFLGFGACLNLPHVICVVQ